ncbi:MAG TPA: hypothetical protein V6D29_13575, partial [Leptolyngbyaceae cyanobacterium]
KPADSPKTVAAAIPLAQPTPEQAIQSVAQASGVNSPGLPSQDSPTAPAADSAPPMPDLGIAPGLNPAPNQPAAASLPGIPPLGTTSNQPTATSSGDELASFAVPETATAGDQNLAVEAQPETPLPASKDESPPPAGLAQQPLSFDQPTVSAATTSSTIPGAEPETHIYTPVNPSGETAVTSPQL